MIYKCFLWEDGQKKTEYTEYMVEPFFFTDNLDETLDNGEIILDCMPIETKTDFSPKTKFRVERYINETDEVPEKYWDLVVELPNVEEYEGASDICTHRLEMIEPSVVLQGMTVDNIALTYELQDVDLNYRTAQSTAETIEESGGLLGNLVGAGWETPIRESEPIRYGKVDEEVIVYFKNSYYYEWRNLESIKNLKYKVDVTTPKEIVFDVPELWARGGNGSGGWTDLFQIPINITVYRETLKSGMPQNDKTSVFTKTYGPESLQAPSSTAENPQYGTTDSGGKRYAGRRKIEGSDYNLGLQVKPPPWEKAYSIDTPISHTGECTEKIIKINLPAVEIGDAIGYRYEISVSVSENANFPEYSLSHHIGIIRGIRNIYGGLRYTETEGAFAGDWKFSKISNSVLSFSASFTALDTSVPTKGNPFLMRGVEYNAYQILRKAMLTLDTRLINNAVTGLDEAIIQDGTPDLNNIQYPIIVNTDWISRLKTTAVYETVFEGKNFWEVCMQMGYYMHAIPYLEFAQDGTDRFMLSFKQLGSTKVEEDNAVKITVFNSLALSDYFSAYDSYVTNLFSPQNIVEEWLIPKTSDTAYLTSNNTAELQVTKGILEVVDFKIYYNDEWKDAIKPPNQSAKIYERSIYEILTNDYRVSPSKADSLYYKLGDTKILGLNHVPPSGKNDQPMALKKIVRQLFGIETNDLMFNSLTFYIKYRTHESARVRQVRPDIKRFMKNSAFEKYPHHEQFYGQQDKIVDSERFGVNLYGKLIKVGNATYQRQEYAEQGKEKEAGDLVVIDDNPYYVMSTENEFYRDISLQKVTYSRNFNQMSQVVTIPSEPRFYEVSERSQVRREVSIMEFLEITTNPYAVGNAPRFLNSDTWRSFVKNVIFHDNKPILPNFAYTRFKGDIKRKHVGENGSTIEYDNLFPSSEVEPIDGTVRPKPGMAFVDCIVPLQHYPMNKSLVFTWDMEDNFKVADYIDPSVNGQMPNTKGRDGAYYGQQPFRYCDVMGRADLYNFKLFNKSDWSPPQVQQLPKAPFIPIDADSFMLTPNGLDACLDKDGREAISFNAQINLIHGAYDGDKEDFITLSNLWGQKRERLRMAICSNLQNMFDQELKISVAVLYDDVPYHFEDGDNSVKLIIDNPTNYDVTEAKSIVLYEYKNDLVDPVTGENVSGRSAYIMKNISKLPPERKLQSWWIYPVYND